MHKKAMNKPWRKFQLENGQNSIQWKCKSKTWKFASEEGELIGFICFFYTQRTKQNLYILINVQCN